ncbi:MAG: long-chain fatty acid--CoA ligase, partial [Bacteroidetes bacterium]|nr:long-chain fatty acid--CoA ligase [Bacteroidota bacterium]
NGLTYTTNEAAIANTQVQQLFQGIIDNYNTLFNHVEQIKKFELLPKEWSLETGEMTPKMSLKRKVILEKFSKEIDKIYC